MTIGSTAGTDNDVVGGDGDDKLSSATLILGDKLELLSELSNNSDDDDDTVLGVDNELTLVIHNGDNRNPSRWAPLLSVESW